MSISDNAEFQRALIDDYGFIVSSTTMSSGEFVDAGTNLLLSAARLARKAIVVQKEEVANFFELTKIQRPIFSRCRVVMG